MSAPLAIVGPTATGKTALAVSLARTMSGVELVSVDAMAVYRGLDVATAKPTAEQRAGIVWHLLDLVGPEEEFSVARFQQAARSVLSDVSARGSLAVLVGGTGLYHRAVLDDLDLPGRYPEIAADLEAEADRAGGLAVLYERLERLDPLAATRIESGNRRRIVRALEVTLGAGRAFSSHGPGLSSYEAAGPVMVGLTLARDELDRRIGSRLDAMFASGLLEEIETLAPSSGAWSRTARQAIGYRELLAWRTGEIDLAQARAEILRRTRAFARRQEAWFRRDPRVRWLDARREDLVEVVRPMLVALRGDGTGT